MSQDPNAFDIRKLFAEPLAAFGNFKLPGLDLNEMMAITRRDFEALGQAQQTALAGLQGAPQDMQKQLMEAYTRMGSVMQQMMATGTQAGGANAMQAVQDATRQALGDLQGLAETATRSQREAYLLLLNRARERTQELTALMGGK